MKKLFATILAMAVLCSLVGITASAGTGSFDASTDQLLTDFQGGGALNPKCYPATDLAFVDGEGLHIVNGSLWVGMDKFYDDEWRTEIASKFDTVCMIIKFQDGASARRFEYKCGGISGQSFATRGIPEDEAPDTFTVYSFPKPVLDKIEKDEDGDICNDTEEACVWAFGCAVWDDSDDGTKDDANVVIQSIWLTSSTGFVWNPDGDGGDGGNGGGDNGDGGNGGGDNGDGGNGDGGNGGGNGDGGSGDGGNGDGGSGDAGSGGGSGNADVKTGDAGVASMIAVAVLAAGAIVISKKRR